MPPSLAVATLDKMHAKHVLPGFKDRSAEERDIEALTMSITKVRLHLSPDPCSTSAQTDHNLAFRRTFAKLKTSSDGFNLKKQARRRLRRR